MKAGFLRLTLSVSFLLLSGFLVKATAQDPVQIPAGIPPESEWVYGKHLEVVEGIMKLPLAEREQKLEGFMKAVNPKAKILQYMPSFFAQIMDEYNKAGMADKGKALSAKMIQLFPNNSEIIYQKFTAAYQAKNFPQAIELGEKIYATKPDNQTTLILADCYLATNNAAKLAEFAPKAVEALGPQKGVGFVVWLADYSASQKNMDKALEYYNTLQQTFPDAPPAGWTAEQWNPIKVKAFAVRGNLAYSKKDYAGAIQSYSESVKIFPQNDGAYFIIGMSQWRLQELDKAMEAFAKVVALGKPTAAKAREYLEQIFKPRHNNTLNGLEEMIAKAKADLKL
jgi:tetratricopeptide (TPR) repeat protein